jgi:hypothetical protein
VCKDAFTNGRSRKRKYRVENWRCKSFFALFIPSLSLPGSSPTPLPVSVFLGNFFVRSPSTDFFTGEFSPFFEKKWKKKYPVSNSLF